jgi:integrase
LWVSKVKKPGYFGDGGGLWLQVSNSGSKSWIFRFTINRKQREMGLGAVHTVSLSEARIKSRNLRLLLQEGIDPIDNREEAKQAKALESARTMTFDQCASKYIETHRSGWRNTKHAGQWESTIATYVNPVFGSFPVSEVDTSLVLKVLSPIWEDKTETAKRLRGRIERILAWATTSGFRQGENPARWRGHFAILLPEKSKKNVKHHPSLPWKEIPSFMSALSEQKGTAARALELLIFTATRTSETLEMTWDELNLRDGVWVIPAERMKEEIEHEIPLSRQAIELLSEMPRISKLVFTGAKYDSCLSDMSLTAVLKRMHNKSIKDGGNGWIDPKQDNRRITSHGFRSSFRMWGAESVSHSFTREVIEFALSHQLPNKVESAYQRGTLFEKRIPLMQAWSDYCVNKQENAKVTQIRKVI